MSAPEATTASPQRLRKQEMAAQFVADCEDTEALFIADYSGIDVAGMSVLREQARAAGGRVRVVKNTVAKRVLADIPALAPLAESLSGQLLYGSGGSATTIAKVLKDFAGDNEALEIKAGVMDGALIDAAGVKRIADLPSREQLLGMLAGTLNAPIAKLARTLAEVPSSLARALAAVRDAKPDSAGDTDQQQA